MDLYEASKFRHSVRSYKLESIDEETKAKLSTEVSKCNAESGLNIQLVIDEPEAFSGLMAHYGKFKNVTNYFAMIGKNDKDLQEKLGYYGEKLVLVAQSLGLNTCWVALTYSKRKSKVQIKKGEKLVCVIALGYGETDGVPHKNKPIENFYTFAEDDPEWMKRGVESAMLAPTAINQQKFKFERNGNMVKATALRGFYTKLDLGIVKFHFELGAGKDNFVWQD